MAIGLTMPGDTFRIQLCSRLASQSRESWIAFRTNFAQVPLGARTSTSSPTDVPVEIGPCSR